MEEGFLKVNSILTEAYSRCVVCEHVAAKSPLRVVTTSERPMIELTAAGCRNVVRIHTRYAHNTLATEVSPM